MYCFPCSAQINSFACILANMLKIVPRDNNRSNNRDRFVSSVGTQNAQKHLDIVDSLHTSMEFFSLNTPQQKVH